MKEKGWDKRHPFPVIEKGKRTGEIEFWINNPEGVCSHSHMRRIGCKHCRTFAKRVKRRYERKVQQRVDM